MSQIGQLISRLCPKGVDYVPLDALFNLRKGENLTNEQAIPGEFQVITASRGSTFLHNDFNFDGECITISSHGAYAGFVSYYNQKLWLGNNVYLFESKTEEISTRFYFHVLKSLAQVLLGTVNKGGIPYINAKDLKLLRVPHPPIEIQNEIVRILDRFTELEAELERELEARKSQYQHFRYKLLQCEGQDYREMELGMFGRVLMCKRIMKDETANFGDVPFYKIGTFGGKPDAYITQAKFDEFRTKYPFPKVGALLISAAGTIGKIVKYRGEPSYFQDSNIVWLDHDESVVLNDYLFHCYKTAKWSTDTGSIPRLYNSNILKLKIKVPSLQEQRRVADFLGLFEMLTNDGVAGIPTEMAARRQQYEYYRNKLLTLKASEVT
jgi:type I restriction enzyme S subunit